MVNDDEAAGRGAGDCRHGAMRGARRRKLGRALLLGALVATALGLAGIGAVVPAARAETPRPSHFDLDFRGAARWLDATHLVLAGKLPPGSAPGAPADGIGVYLYDVENGATRYLHTLGSPIYLCVVDDTIVLGADMNDVAAGEKQHDYRWRGRLASGFRLERLRYPRSQRDYQWNDHTCRMEKLRPLAVASPSRQLLREGDGLVFDPDQRWTPPYAKGVWFSADGERQLEMPMPAEVIKNFFYVAHRQRYLWYRSIDVRQFDDWRSDDCMQAWWLDVRVPSVTPDCVPWSGLQSTVPYLVALPMRTGWLTASGPFGGPGRPDVGRVVFVPYRAEGGHEAPVTLFEKGVVPRRPALSPDGCRVAMAYQTQYQPRISVWRILDVCPE